MEKPVAAVPAAPDPKPAQAQPPPEKPKAPPVAKSGSVATQIVEGALDPADLRLVIEEVGGTYVYKTVDRRTGDVVAQYPREQILKMREGEDYSAGDVFKTRI